MTFLIIVSMCVSSISNKNKINTNCWIIYNLITSFHTVCMFLVNIGNHHSFLSYDDVLSFEGPYFFAQNSDGDIMQF